MAELSLDQAIPRFKANENRMDIFTNGSDTTVMTTSGGVSVPSLAKFIKDKDTYVNGVGNTILSGAQTAATNAANSASAASGSQIAAGNSATLASQWASNAEDVQVTAGKYSALHWAAKAQASAASVAASATPVANRTALRALDQTVKKVAIISGENGRNGTFVAVTGNLSGVVGADSQQGIYVAFGSDSSGASGAWVRVFDGQIQAEWFGVVADNATDNAPYLNAALNAIKTMGRQSLRLPPGVIRVGSTINVTSGFIFIQGSGVGATTVRRTFASGNIFYFAVTAPAQIPSIGIDGISFDSIVTSTGGAAIYVEAGDGVWISNINISGSFNGIYLAGNFEARVSNVRIGYGGTSPNNEIGFTIAPSNPSWGIGYGGNIYLNNCSIITANGSSGSPGANIGLICYAVDGLFVTNSYFGYFSNTAVILSNTWASNAYLTGVSFSNCWFDHASGVGVQLTGSLGPNFTNIKFDGCTFLGGTAATNNLAIEGSSGNVKAIGCFFNWVNRDNLKINTTGQDITVSGSTINLANINGAGGEGIRVYAGIDVTISDNKINGMSKTGNGVFLNAGTGHIVTGNRVKNCINGITTNGAVNYYIITENIVQGNSGSGISDGATGSSKIVDRNF